MKSAFRIRRPIKALLGTASVAVLLLGCGGNDGSNSSPAVLRVLQDQFLVANAVGTPGSQTSMLAQFVFEVPTPFAPLGGLAGAYEITPNEPTSDQLSRLAETFAVTDPFVAQAPEFGGGLFAGPNDGTAPMLSVMNDVMAVWNYSPAWANAVVDECLDSTTSSETGTGELDTECYETTPPQDLPTFDEAREMFSTLMSELDVRSDDLIIEVSGDEWGVTVSGFKKIDGIRSPFTWSVTYGENGSIVVAYGPLNDEVRELGDYPRITTDEALDRLRDEQSAPPFDSGTGVVQPDSYEGPAVLLDSVEEELYVLYGVDGEVYLVPGYTFIGAPADADYVQRFIVSALPEAYVERVDMSPSDGSVSPPGSGTPGSPGDGVTNPPGQEPIDPMPPEIPLNEANALLGMTEAEAADYAENQGWAMRIASRDGEQFALTMDYSPTRVNLSIEQGLVTYVFIG
jgi:hypothetical protein